MVVKDTALVASTAAVAGGGTYAIQSGSSTENEPTAKEVKNDSLKNSQTKNADATQQASEVFDSLIVDTVSSDYEELSKLRFSISNVTRNKLLLGWSDINPWIKKVQDNVTKRNVWPNDLIFKSNRSDNNLARLLRQKCYLASDYLSRVHFNNSDNSDEYKKELFKNVDGQFNDSTLITLCASDQTFSNNENKYTGSSWKTLVSYEEEAKNYTVSEQAPSNNTLASEFHKTRKTQVDNETFKESIEKYSFFVFKRSGVADKFATKENFGLLYDKLEDIPFFSGVLTKKQ